MRAALLTCRSRSRALGPGRLIAGPEQQLSTWLVQAGVGAARVLVLLGDTGAAHRDGDIVLGVDGAAARAGRCAAQDHGRHKDRGAAEVEVLFTEGPGQAAPAQAVGFRQVPREPRGVVGDPVGRPRRAGGAQAR